MEDRAALPDPSPAWWRTRRGLLFLAVAGVLLLGAITYLLIDLDQDGLSTFQELRAGTHPALSDTDGDHLADGWEVTAGLSPLERDTDGDGLRDARELLLRTDPLDPDSDGDGLEDAEEVALGTDPADSDTDEDEVADGVEIERGADPRLWDTDGDGVGDGPELLLGGDPRANDTDGDGLTDDLEARLAEADCNGNGVLAIADADDDSDGLIDGTEPADQRCQPDTDGDGLLDGEEAHPACVARVDCDLDGLPDTEELALAYDRLDPDTFGTGLTDGVAKAFQDQGQAPSRDDDRDGIPDAWEETTGLIDWGPYQPTPGAPDLLLEFVRVMGPDSKRYSYLDLETSYRQVEAFLEQAGGLAVTWVETTVELEEERRPPLVPSSQASYYQEVIGRSAHGANPYVTTVVMNPQHDQGGLVHFGIAPIRSMVGAVDYGAHTTIDFQVGNGTVELSPLLESLIVADRQELVNASSFEDAGRTPDGRLFLKGEDYTMSWHPFWFQSNPLWISDQGDQVTFFNQGGRIDTPELTHTIAHELGHTLGLCHTELESCQQNLSIEDQGDLGRSMMDNTAPGGELFLLPSEWRQVRDYVACPPQHPIGILAAGGDRSEVLSAKYEVTLGNVLNASARTCQDRDPLQETLEPVDDPVRYRPPGGTLTEDDLEEPGTLYVQPASLADPVQPTTGIAPTVAYAAAWVLAAGLSGLVVARYAGRSRDGP